MSASILRWWVSQVARRESDAYYRVCTDRYGMQVKSSQREKWGQHWKKDQIKGEGERVDFGCETFVLSPAIVAFSFLSPKFKMSTHILAVSSYLAVCFWYLASRGEFRGRPCACVLARAHERQHTLLAWRRTRKHNSFDRGSPAFGILG